MSTTSYIGRKVKLTDSYVKTIPQYTEGEKNEGIIKDDKQGNTKALWVVEIEHGVRISVFGPDNPEAECILLEETNQEALDRLQLQPGDIVRVISNDNDGGGGWAEPMEECMGQSQEVQEIDEDGSVSLWLPDKKANYWYRPQILEVVSRTAGKQQPEQTPAADNHTILDTAKSLIYGDREKEYGKAIDNIGNIAKMWTILLQKEVTMEQVVECMIAVKQCRLINQPNHMDSWIDICGYAALKEKINKGL